MAESIIIPAENGLKILALGECFSQLESEDQTWIHTDDGGVPHGYSELLHVEETMSRLQYENHLDIMPRPADVFDLIGGTGMGGYVIFYTRMTVGSELPVLQN